MNQNFLIKIGLKDGRIILAFEKEVKWLSFTIEQAEQLCDAIMETALLMDKQYGGTQ